MSKFEKGILIPYIIGIGLLIFCMFVLTGCEVKPGSLEYASIEYSDFDLTVDRSTGIVYIDNYTAYDCHVYTPYYSSNGKLCKFVDGKVVEIE